MVVRGVGPAAKKINESIDLPDPDVAVCVAILASVVMVLAAAGGLTLVATVYQDALPALMLNTRFTPTLHVVVAGIWTVALIVR